MNDCFLVFVLRIVRIISFHLKEEKKIPTEDLLGLSLSLSLLHKHREALYVTTKLFQQDLATVVSGYDE
jgi:hypothetical protein